MKIVVEGRLPSFNKFYSGISHWERTTLKDTWTQLVRLSLPTEYTMYTVPVDIWVTAYYRGTPCDADNLCAKLCIDAIKGHLIKDDSPKYVNRVVLQSRHYHQDLVVVDIDEAELE